MTGPPDPASRPPPEALPPSGPPPAQWVMPPPVPTGSTWKYCHACGNLIDARAEICPRCGVRQPASGPGKSRAVAAFLALFLGWIGIHRFYLGNTVLGIIYLLFFWTGIPALVGWIEGILYLVTSDEAWAQQHGGPVVRSNGLAIGFLLVFALAWMVFTVALVSLAILQYG